jgi:hypothetical protein
MLACLNDNTAERVRSLMEFYSVRAYRPDMRPMDIDPSSHSRDVEFNLEACIEELAVTWGLNWFRIGGMSLPLADGPPPPAPTPPVYPSPRT